MDTYITTTLFKSISLDNNNKFLFQRKAAAAAAAAKSLQPCPTLCDPIEGSPPGSPIPGILQARTLEWVAISFSNAWKWKVKVKLLSYVQLFTTTWIAAYQVLHPWDFPGKSTGVGCHWLLWKLNRVKWYQNVASEKQNDLHRNSLWRQVSIFCNISIRSIRSRECASGLLSVLFSIRTHPLRVEIHFF